MRCSGGDLLGVTSSSYCMPLGYLNTHPEIRRQFWDPQHWPKHVLIRNTWKEQSEIDDVSSGFVLFGSRFKRESVVESSSNIEEFGEAD